MNLTMLLPDGRWQELGLQRLELRLLEASSAVPFHYCYANVILAGEE